MKLLKFISLVVFIQCLLFTKTIAQMQNNPSTISMTDPQIGVAWGFLYGIHNAPENFLPQLKKMDVHLTKLYLFW